MFCGNCGKEIDENEKICPECGKAININKPLPKINRIHKLCFIVVGIALLIIVGIKRYNSLPTNQIVRNLEAGYFDSAYEIYLDNYEYGESSKYLNKKLLEIVRSAEDDLINEKGSQDVQCETVKTVKEMRINKINDEVSEIYDNMISLVNDRETIKAAQEYEKSEDKIQALNEYKAINENSRLYEDAKSAIDRIEEDIKKEITEKQANILTYGNNKLDTINDLLKKSCSEDIIKPMLDEIKNNYKKEVTESIENSMNNSGYEKAYTLVLNEEANHIIYSNFVNDYAADYIVKYITAVDIFNKSLEFRLDKIAENSDDAYSSLRTIGALDGYVDILDNKDRKYGGGIYILPKKVYADYLITGEETTVSLSEIFRNKVALCSLSNNYQDEIFKLNFDTERRYYIFTSKDGIWVYYSLESGEKKCYHKEI